MDQSFGINSKPEKVSKKNKNVLDVKFNPDHLRKEKKKKLKQLSYLELFKHASIGEKSLLWMGFLLGSLNGCIMPFIIAFYGEYTTLLIDRNTPNKTTVTPTIITTWFGGGRPTNGTSEDKAAAIKEDAFAFGVGFVLISMLHFSISFAFVASLNYSALLQTARLRREFLKAVLRQEMSWYDSNNVNSFASKMIEGLDKLQEGIGEKIGMFSYLVMGFVSSVTMAFFYGWKLTLVMLTCAPVLTIAQAMVCKVQTNLKEREMEAYGKAGSVAEEVFSSIKTVMAFSGQKKEIERYDKELEDSRKAGIRGGILSGLGGGIMWFITYSCYALAFWYGVSLILESRLANNFEYTPAVLLITFFGVLVGAINLGMSIPHLEAFSAARGAATSIFSILDRTSEIDSLSSKGKILADSKGEILFQNVSFRYPSRPEIEVLKKITLHVKYGQMVALVGASGSGKSTVLQLLQRFYDPTDGSVQLDGVDLQDFNVQWLRKQLGIVGQEPVLFATTIYENIKYGLDFATQENVEEAAKLADAHDFIIKLPNGYHTMLGNKGSLISGGQKQRIAIARALIRNPKILLLDEATSALDAASESKIQETLDKVAEGRTTLVVTHKLSTIKKADKIVVLSEGQVVEEGNHEELINLRGHYFKLLEMQKNNEKNSKKSTADDETTTETLGDNSNEKGSYDLHDDDEITPKVVTEEKATSSPEKLSPASFFKILRYNKPEWWAILIGMLSTFVVGTNVPALSVIFGELYGVLSDSDSEYIESATAYYSAFLFVLGILIGAATFVQSYMLTYSSVKLTSRFRTLGFAAILSQEASWFDNENNQTGALCVKLSSDSANIQGATGTRIGVIVQSASTILFGLIVGFAYSWKMTLITLVNCPILFFGLYYEAKIIQGQSLLEKGALEKATKISIEAISNIRTVASLGMEKYFLDRYDESLLIGEAKMKNKSKLRGCIYALGSSSTYLSYAFSLWYGGYLIANDEIHYKNVIKVTEALLFGMWVLSQSLAFAPNFSEAKISAARLFDVLHRSPKLKDGTVVKAGDWKTDGRVKFSQVEFAYPSRPEDKVLRGLNLDITKGLSIALIGPSGCGKSTVLQLLQRLYDPCGGNIYLDDDDISSLKLTTLRHQFGIVSQEPVLFDRTIAENIAYGDNSRVVTETEIINAAKSANIHDFIVSLPLGYETRVGSGGGQLSGGQKQRVAIARALIRNPAVLLLDEATSALDAKSESVVQATLDSVSVGRTLITVGHRLGAIKKADVIYCIKNGKISQFKICKES